MIQNKLDFVEEEAEVFSVLKTTSILELFSWKGTKIHPNANFHPNLYYFYPAQATTLYYRITTQTTANTPKVGVSKIICLTGGIFHLLSHEDTLESVKVRPSIKRFLMEMIKCM